MLRAKYNLNGHPSLKGATKMRVFCPEHKRGFFAPRQSPIKCENRGHILGALDFEGEASVPAEVLWQYCCNCEHFAPVDFVQSGLERCPVCTRRSSLLYLCDRCHVISFESNTPLPTKNFTLNADGVPQPSCPGCLRAAAIDSHEHYCEQLDATFITALNTCPICDERLDVAPSFPSPVALYLKRTRTANKSNVTFDYETESFMAVEDGEFVVVTGSDPAIVLPRASRFAARRDFYEYYQDYYHCPNPDAGEVKIVQPAVVKRAGHGWKLETTGVLEVTLDQPRKKIVPAVMREEVAASPKPPEPEPAPVAPPVSFETNPESAEKPCSECGAMVESRYAFCWKCGHALTPDSKPSRTNNPARGSLLASAFLEDDELTVQHELQAPSASVFPWAAPGQPDYPSSSRGSVLKLMAIGGVALLVAVLGLFGLTRSDSQATTTAETPTQTVAENTPAAAPVESTQPAVHTQVVSEAPSQPLPSVRPEDELLARMRERRITATNSDRPKIFEAFARIERKYPRDYRFPYERAKLAAKGSKSESRKEAFKALSAAAERAIATGKATEMLSGLETDKAGDFYRLAQGRQEWSRLVVALKRKDTSLLAAKTQFQ
jgi:hypothetical protein